VTEGELCEWLNLRPADMAAKAVRLRREIVEGMKDVPFPAPGADKAQLRTYARFLECAGSPGDSIVEPVPEGEG
jgi:hypothetical protein